MAGNFQIENSSDESLYISNPSSSASIQVTPQTTTSTSTSTGGAVVITNTLNDSYALNVYSRDNSPSRFIKFDVQPAYNTTVSGAQTIDTSSTSLTVASTSGFPSTGTLRVLNSASTTENGNMIYLHYTSIDSTHFYGSAGVFYKVDTAINLINAAIVYYANSTNTYIHTLIEDPNINGGSVNLKLRGPNPDLEFHALGGYYNSLGEGQFEIDIPQGDNVTRTSTDCLRINGRNDANDSFEPNTIFTRPGLAGKGMVGIGFQNKTDPVTLNAKLHIKNDDFQGDASAALLIGQIIQGASGQSANLQEIQNDAGALLYGIDASGAMIMANSRAPTVASTQGGLFVSGAALWFKGGSGTQTKLANA